MSYLHIEEEPVERTGVPKVALRVAGAMALGTIILAAVARLSNAGTLAPPPVAAVVSSRALVFTDRPDGSIGVRDVGRNQDLPPIVGEGGFVRGSLRALARQRRLARVGPEVPFYLSRLADGRIVLDDSATKNHLELQAYGPDNTAAFLPLLPP